MDRILVKRSDLQAIFAAAAAVQGERGERISRFLAAWAWAGTEEEGFLSDYCDAALSWVSALRRSGAPGAMDFYSVVRLDISKSNLLSRMIYDNEPVRLEPCPVHAGKWSGLDVGPDFAAKGMGKHCPECELTGWKKPAPGSTGFLISRDT